MHVGGRINCFLPTIVEDTIDDENACGTKLLLSKDVKIINKPVQIQHKRVNSNLEINTK